MDISKAKLASGRRFIVDIGRDPYEREKVLQNGSKLYLDPSYRPTHHAKTYGTVKATYRGSEVDNGDKVYFHYTCIEMEDAMQYIEGDTYLMVPADMCFFKVNANGLLTSLNDRVAILPHTKEPKMLTERLYSSQGPIKSERQGLVVCHPDNEMVGKKVFFHHRNAFENDVEGQKVYVMYAEAIHGILDDWLEE